MKRIKRFMLIIVIVIGVPCAYISIKPSKFKVVRSIEIGVPSGTLYNYINNYTTWQEWNSWIIQDKTMVLKYGSINKGVDAFYSWNGKDGSGSMKTISVETDSYIEQEMTFEESVSTVKWTFEEKEKNTIVTWSIEGKLNFMMKAISLFLGGMDKMIGEEYERSLATIKRNISKKYNDVTFEYKGITEHGGGFYLYLPIRSTTAEEFNYFFIERIEELIKYANKNGVEIIGAPFTIFTSFQKENTWEGRVALPIGERVYTDSSILPIGCKYLDKQKVLKGVHKGIYKSLKESWNTLNTYSRQQKFETNGYLFEVYRINRDDTSDATEWVTDMYIPIK